MTPRHEIPPDGLLHLASISPAEHSRPLLRWLADACRLGLDPPRAVVAQCRRTNPEIDHEVRRILTLLETDLPNADDEIAWLYGQAASQAEAGDERSLQATMRRIRELETAQVQRLAEEFRARDPLTRERVDEVLERTEEFIARHAGPSGPHKTG